MLFNSFVFPVFFLIAWSLYLCLKHRPQNLMLLFASYFFYGWWDWRFLGLLFISTFVDFFVAKSMGKCGPNRQGTKKALLFFSLFTSLGILGFFKYFNFFAQSLERVVAPLGLQPDFVTLNILLPVGISFYSGDLCPRLFFALAPKQASRYCSCIQGVSIQKSGASLIWRYCPDS